MFRGLLLIFSVGLLVPNLSLAQSWPNIHLTNGVHSSSYGVENSDRVYPYKYLYVERGAVLNAGDSQLDHIYGMNEVVLNGGQISASAIDADDFTWNSGRLQLNANTHTTVYGFSGGSQKSLIVTETAKVDLDSDLSVGSHFSNYNSLFIDRGSVRVDGDAKIGHYAADANLVQVQGKQAQWVVSDSLILGHVNGSGNQLNVLDGGQVSADNGVVGAIGQGGRFYQKFSNDNSIFVSGSNSTLTLNHLTVGHKSINGFVYADANAGNEVTVESGGRIEVKDGLSIVGSQNKVTIKQGGTLAFGADFDASLQGFYFKPNGTLTVEGTLSGLPVVTRGTRVEASSVEGDLLVEGLFAAGPGLKRANISGDLTVAEEGMIELDLTATEHDQLSVGGLASLNGILNLMLSDEFSATNGARFDLFDWEGGVEGEFASIVAPELGGDLRWSYDDLYSTGELNVIPEPLSVALLFALIPFMMLRRVLYSEGERSSGKVYMHLNKLFCFLYRESARGR